MGETQEKRKYNLGILILLIFLCWPAAIIYYFTRPKVKPKPKHICVECGREMLLEYNICPYCGRTVVSAAPTPVVTTMPTPPLPTPTPFTVSQPSPSTVKCSACGYMNPPDSAFCEQCGSNMATMPYTPTREMAQEPTPEAPPSHFILGYEVMVKCSNCGHMNPIGSTSCEQCGASLVVTPSETPREIVLEPTPPAPAVKVPRIEGVLILPDRSELLMGTKRVIGRDDLAEYASPTEAWWISKQHFTIFQKEGSFYIQDDGSTNGTKLNGTEIRNRGRQKLKDGDEVLVADIVKLLFRVRS